MGKKNKKDNKGKGKEKTSLKTEKKAEKRAKKKLSEKGEEFVEKLIAQIQEEGRKISQVLEEKCGPPSPRSSMTLSVHPDKDELIMFGGEFFAHNKIQLYNDLLFYNIKKDEWVKVSAPNAPPPRSSHQAVALKQGGGQLWIFGGEFASPSQSQFYHYSDLWIFWIKEKKWEKVNSPGGPSARSGHRMVNCRKQLFVFGGFHDNIRDYKYFNDVHVFNLETYTWSKLDVSGSPPEPRSSCMLLPLQDQTRVLMYGGYKKERVRKDVDRGKTHIDMFLLAPEGRLKEEVVKKWKWQPVKQSGVRPSPRCGFAAVIIPGNRAVCFGGVCDEEENEEQLRGVFHNDMYSLELDKFKWYDLLLRGKKSVDKKKRRRKDKPESGKDEDMNANEEEDFYSDEEDDMEIAAEIESIVINNPAEIDKGAGCIDTPTGEIMSQDGVFTVTIGAQSQAPTGSTATINEDEINTFEPCPRMNPVLAVKNGILYMYGGLFEVGDKQFTLSDFYSLDLHKLDNWNIIIKNDLLQNIDDSDSSSSDEEEMDEACEGREDDDSEDEMELTFDDAPDRKDDEDQSDYFDRTKDYWVGQAQSYCQTQGLHMSDRKISKLAVEMCLDVCENEN